MPSACVAPETAENGAQACRETGARACVLGSDLMMPRADDRPHIDDPWEDLVVSVLSVNNYSLERTYKSLAALREQGLVDPRRLEQWDQVEIASRLKAAGCDRGPFMTNLFALRLANVGELIRRKGVRH